jgi:hypothetical protein
MGELLQAARYRGEIESGPARADRVDPENLVTIQQVANQVLAARRMPAPVVGENQEWWTFL